MLKLELKKIFIKQFSLILILLVAAVKLFTSFDLFKPDYSGLSRQQQAAYLEYIDELGGQLTDEKEAKIRELYSQLLQAQSMQEEFQRKLNAGEYSSVNDYFADIAAVPAVISDKDAITKLFHNYEVVNEDREHRIIIASDAPVLTVDIEYLLMFLLCYMSAAAYHYERKTNNLQKTTPQNINANVGKIFSLFLAVLLAWGLFAVIEFFALVSETVINSLSASIVSLESFSYSNYPNMSIFSVFISIHLIKLIGYLLVSSLAAFLARTTKNFPLSVFVPAAINVVWIYLFGSSTISFYNPFSLMRGAPYFIGGDHINQVYDTIPQSVLITLICISLAVITAIVIFLTVSGRNKIKKFIKSAAVILSVLALCGCSQNTAEITANPASSVVYSNGKYFICNDEYTEDPDGRIIITGTNISACDENLEIIEEKLNRNVFESKTVISQLAVDGDYLYYSDQSRICRIDLTDYSEKTMIEFDSSEMSSGTTRYLDLIRDYPAEYTERGDYEIDSFIVNGNKIILLMRSEKVYSLDINTGITSYLFEDVEIENICTANGRLFFTDRMGRLTLFDGEKKTVSDRIFPCICADGGFIYACNSDGVFRYDPVSFEETTVSDTGGSFLIVRNGRIYLSSDIANYIIDESGEREATLPEGYYFESLSNDGRRIVRHDMKYMILDEN